MKIIRSAVVDSVALLGIAILVVSAIDSLTLEHWLWNCSTTLLSIIQ